MEKEKNKTNPSNDNNPANLLKSASKFLIAKDTKNNKFQNIARPGTSESAKGDYLYLMADTNILVFFIFEDGKIDPNFFVRFPVADMKLDGLSRLMVLDQNIMTLCDKEITVFQFQNGVIQQKQKFQAFKDIEDIAISRIDGVRIFKAKGTKGKFKVFSTLPSSDWNPYIEGVSKKSLLEDKEYPKIELLDAQYGNIVIMAYTGKHYKYFVVISGHLGQRHQLFFFQLH